MTVRVKQLRPGSWYLVICHKGKRIVRRVADSKDQADKIKTELEKELVFRGYGALDSFKPRGKGYGLTVSSYADRWISEVGKSGLKLSTVRSYESNLKLHIKPFFDDLPLADVTYSKVKDFIADRMGECYRRGEAEDAPKHAYSKDSIRIMIATLSAMLSEAVREELIEMNPVHGVGRFYSAAKKLRDDPDPFSLLELHVVEQVAGQMLPFLLFQSRTGARVGEAIALQWRDVDFDKGQARISRTMPIHREVGSTKTPASTRTVDLSPELIDALMALQAKQRAFWFAKGQDMPEWVFATAEGNAPDYSVFRRSFRRLQRKAKIRERRPHDLRHTYASIQLAQGKPISYVAAQLGHKSPQITLSIYARWVPGQDSGRRDSMDKNRQPDANGQPTERKRVKSR